MKKIGLLSLLAVLSLSSCLKDDNDYFDQSATERINEAIENASKVLQGAPNGWRMELYPEATRIYGGYTVLAKFGTDGQVTVSSENFSPDESATSYYSISAESGPMLSFDTYNTIFHFYADATTWQTYKIGSAQRGLDGDSDFIVMSADAECVHLRGRKTGNDVYMYPIDGATDWATELSAYADVAERVQLAFDTCEVDGVSYPVFYESALNNFTARKFKITYADADITIAYSLTKTGIKFYEPLVLGSHEVTEMNLVDDWYLASADGGVKIYSPEPIRSEITFAVDVTDVTYSNATVTVTPSTDEEYYYWNVFEKSALAGYSDRSLLRSLLETINSYSPDDALYYYGDQGASDYAFTSLLPDTEYVVVLFGLSVSRDGKTIVSTTDPVKYEFRTDPMPPLDAAYEQWLGDWEVTSASSTKGNVLTYDVTISMFVPNQSVKVTGLSITSLRKSFSPTANYKSDGTLEMAQQELGPYSNSSRDYILYYYPFYVNPTSGANTRFNTTRVALKGSHTGEGTAVFESGDATSSSVGAVKLNMEIYGQSGSSWYTFGPSSSTSYTSGDFGTGPFTMKKVASASRSIQATSKTALTGTMMALEGLRNYGTDDEESFIDDLVAFELPSFLSDYEVVE